MSYLNGTEKQIKYAESIVDKTISKLEDLEEMYEAKYHDDNDAAAVALCLIRETEKDIRAIQSAKFIIENQDLLKQRCSPRFIDSIINARLKDFARRGAAEDSS